MHVQRIIWKNFWWKNRKNFLWVKENLMKHLKVFLIELAFTLIWLKRAKTLRLHFPLFSYLVSYFVTVVVFLFLIELWLNNFNSAVISILLIKFLFSVYDLFNVFWDYIFNFDEVLKKNLNWKCSEEMKEILKNKEISRFLKFLIIFDRNSWFWWIENFEIRFKDTYNKRQWAKQ